MRESNQCSPVILTKEMEGSRSRSPTCYGNMFIRRQYFGSMELVVPTDDSTGPLLRKVGRFRVEPSNDTECLQTPRSPSLAKLENPEFQTRWYFKFFLGVVHRNYVFLDLNKEPYALSVCLTDVENHGIHQYRAILWRKQGCCRICIPYIPNKNIAPKEVLRHFGFDKLDRTPREILSPDVQKEFLILEEQEGSVYFKFGVIYAKTGQSTDDEMFGNVSGSEEFDNFLHVLGDVIELKGWKGYRGGLDEKDNMTGVNSVYTIFEGHEVMFHVSVMLPYSKDTQQVERKRHIGNDIAVIVFVDGEPDEELAFKPSSIRTKFTHVFAVIRYSKKTKDYWMSVFSEESVPVFGPPIPVPARFKNPQEFRSFLLTKLMNGEKAAYVSPVFSNKRQRTLESLIKGLQTDQWSKPERFGIKRAVSMQMKNHSDKKRSFVEIGQSLKVNMITLGRAPTSVANVGGLQALKNTPWNTLPVLSSFARSIICGDSYHSTLIVSCDNGIYQITDTSSRLIYDSSMTAIQLNVLENFGILVMRLKKDGRIYVIPLQELESKHPFTICRRQCVRYYLKKSKGSHLHTLSLVESPSLVLALAVGRRISLYCWKGSISSTSSVAEKTSPTHTTLGEFEKKEDFFMTSSPKSLTIVQSTKSDLHICLGFRTRFDVINAQTKSVAVLKNFVAYRKSKIVSALGVFDDQNPELLLTYSHTSVFVRLREGLSEVVTFHWNNAPSNIVCAFPFLLGFSENAIEIRLLVNGNLVHTLCVPGIRLITAKDNIYFSSSKLEMTKERKKNTLSNQTFSMIKLSDLAGFDVTNNKECDEIDGRDFSTLSLPRNIGVYDSIRRRDGSGFKRLDMTTRSFSSAASLGYMNKEKFKVEKARIFTTPDTIDRCSENNSQRRRISLSTKARSSDELNKIDAQHYLGTKIKSNCRGQSKRPNRISLDGSTVPIPHVNTCPTFDASNYTTRSSPDFPKTSFFYTKPNTVIRNPNDNPIENKIADAPPCKNLAQKFMHSNERASIKSLPDHLRDKSLKCDNDDRSNSTHLYRKNNTPEYNLTVTYSMSTFPFSKKSTIV